MEKTRCPETSIACQSSSGGRSSSEIGLPKNDVVWSYGQQNMRGRKRE
jgi:hypothetical protein